MGRNGDPLIRWQHVVDAALVGAIAFAAVLLADVLPTLLAGDPAFLTLAELTSRAPTAAVASLLAFAAQWARARGLDVLEYLPVGSE